MTNVIRPAGLLAIDIIRNRIARGMNLAYNKRERYRAKY